MEKGLFVIAGYISLGLGILGSVLPVLPTTPFLILAAYCFKRGSSNLYVKLITHPTFGAPIKDWETHRMIAPKNKFLACIMLFICLGYPIGFKNYPLGVKVLLFIIGVSVMTFILTRKSRPTTSQKKLA